MNIKNGMILLMAALLVFMAAGVAYQHREAWLHGLGTVDQLSTAKVRAERAAQADCEGKPIEIGVIGPWSVKSVPVTNLLRGIELAAGLINRQGGLDGRTIQLLVRDCGTSAAEAGRQMQAFCEQPSVAAVIGGIKQAEYAVQRPLAEFNGLLYLAPVMPPDVEPVDSSNRFSFCTCPPNAAAVEAVRDGMDAEDLRTVAILGPPEFHAGFSFCNAFDRAMPRDRYGEAGVIDRVMYSLPVDQAFIQRTLRFWSDMIDYDMLLFAGDAEAAALVLEQAGSLHHPPVLFLSAQTTVNQLEAMTFATNLYVRVLSPYDPRSEKPTREHFAQAYREAYGEEPDWLAAQGYDTLNLMAAGVREAGSAVPVRVADTLRSMTFFENVSAASNITFNTRGCASGRLVLLPVGAGGANEKKGSP